MSQNRNDLHEAFIRGIAQRHAVHVWDQIKKIAKDKPTRRTLRGKLQPVKGVTNDQLSFNVNRDPGTVGRWFNKGSINWIYLSFVMTDLRIPLCELTEELSREDRIRQGRIEVLYQAKINRKPGIRVARLCQHDLAYLELLMLSPEWKTAHKVRNPDRRKDALVAFANTIFDKLKSLDRSIERRSPKELIDLQDDWGGPWEQLQHAIQVVWSVQ